MQASADLQVYVVDKFSAKHPQPSESKVRVAYERGAILVGILLPRRNNGETVVCGGYPGGLNLSPGYVVDECGLSAAMVA